MGTYTNYELAVSIKDSDKHKYNAKAIISHLRAEYYEANTALYEDGTTANEAKWYESDNDMKEFSKKYPDVLFSLSQTMEGEGDDYDEDEEEFDDLEWTTCFKDGQELSMDEVYNLMKVYPSF